MSKANGGFIVATVPAESWTKVAAFYRDLIDHHGWRQAPMLDFVTWLASSSHSRALFASTSHEALGLARVPSYEERLQRPMVYVVYSESRGFEILWQRGQGHTVRTDSIGLPQSIDVMQRILSWLDAEGLDS